MILTKTAMNPSFLTAHTPTTIAIVGAGFSGSLVATHLLLAGFSRNLLSGISGGLGSA
ncbi:MAG: hypothetical protein ACYTXY_34030 [Nostoc sp.]